MNSPTPSHRAPGRVASIHASGHITFPLPFTRGACPASGAILTSAPCEQVLAPCQEIPLSALILLPPPSLHQRCHQAIAPAAEHWCWRCSSPNPRDAAMQPYAGGTGVRFARVAAAEAGAGPARAPDAGLERGAAAASEPTTAPVGAALAPATAGVALAPVGLARLFAPALDSAAGAGAGPSRLACTLFANVSALPADDAPSDSCFQKL